MVTLPNCDYRDKRLLDHILSLNFNYSDIASETLDCWSCSITKEINRLRSLLGVMGEEIKVYESKYKKDILDLKRNSLSSTCRWIITKENCAYALKIMHTLRYSITEELRLRKELSNKANTLDFASMGNKAIGQYIYSIWTNTNTIEEVVNTVVKELSRDILVRWVVRLNLHAYNSSLQRINKNGLATLIVINFIK